MNIIGLIRESYEAGVQSRVLEEIFKNTPYISINEAERYFPEFSKYRYTDQIEIIKRGGNRKAMVSVADLIKLKAAKKIEKATKLIL